MKTETTMLAEACLDLPKIVQLVIAQAKGRRVIE